MDPPDNLQKKREKEKGYLWIPDVRKYPLQEPDAVLEWMKGTALRPVFTRLAPDRHDVFLGEYRKRLREAYPEHSYGTLFPFRRLFFVAQNPRA